MPQMNISEQKIFPYESVDLAKTFPEWNSPLLSADYGFIQTFEERKRVRTELVEKEIEAEFFNTEMKMKWEKLRTEQVNFLDEVRNYDQFYRENEYKCKRISAKITKELVKQDNYERKIGICEKRNEYLSHVLETMGDSVNTLLPYNDFLEKLIAHKELEEINSINAFINTFMLLTSQRKLHDEFACTLLEIENLNLQMHEYKAVKNAVFSRKTNDLFRTKKQYDFREEDLLLLSNQLAKQNIKLQNETEETLMMRWSYNNVYHLLCKWKKIHPSCRLEDNDEKNQFIEKTVDELRLVVKQAQELIEKSDVSNEADSSFMTVKRLI